MVQSQGMLPHPDKGKKRNNLCPALQRVKLSGAPQSLSTSQVKNRGKWGSSRAALYYSVSDRSDDNKYYATFKLLLFRIGPILTAAGESGGQMMKRRKQHRKKTNEKKKSTSVLSTDTQFQVQQQRLDQHILPPPPHERQRICGLGAT